MATRYVRRRKHATPPANQAGFSLSELLIALMLGGLMVAAMLRLHVYMLATNATVAALADINDRAGFILAELERDILLAGYTGGMTNEAVIDTSAATPISCSGKNVNTWALQLTTIMHAESSLPCPAANPTEGSDILTVRRSSAMPVAARAGSVQLEALPDSGRLFTDGNPVGPGEVYDLRIHSWYVDSRSSEPGTQALRRLTLVHGGRLQSEEVMPGVEKLELSFAVDSNDDGIADAIVTPAQLRTQMVDAVAIRVDLHMRTPMFDQSAPHADGRRRARFSRLIRLRNR